MKNKEKQNGRVVVDNKPTIEGNKITIPLSNFPFPINPTNIQFQAVQTKVVPSILRRRHIKVNAEFVLLDIHVAKLYFKKEIKKFKEKSFVYKSIWSIREIYFPNIFLNIYSTNGKIMFVLSINLRNYNYFPPEIGLLTPNMQILKNIDYKFINPDNDGNIHVKNHPLGVWFCTAGTYKYHDFYFDIDRWELERYNNTCELIEIINRVVGMINRNQDDI